MSYFIQGKNGTREEWKTILEARTRIGSRDGKLSPIGAKRVAEMVDGEMRIRA